MTSLLQFAAILGWAGCAAGLVWYTLNAARQITYATLADGRRQRRVIPLVFRLLLPLSPNVEPFFAKPAFTSARAALGAKLTAAGYEGVITPTEFLSIKLLVPVVFGSAWFVLLRLMIRIFPEIASNAPQLALGGVLLFYLYPLLWLKSVLAARHRSIQRALPFVLDLLTLAVEAGLDFMTALQRNCERRALDPLNEELIYVIREIQLGAPRRVALRNLSTRVGLNDLRSVTYALIQADELGVSIGAILRIQSDQMRQRRFERAERLANEAPVKMLGPLMLFIFPAVFIILLGPTLTQVRGQLF
jgi:tight adherence protein C